MADNYEQFSEMLVVPEEKRAEVIAFLTRKEEDDGEYYPADWAMETEGLWLHSDYGFDEESLIEQVQGVLNIIDSDEPFIISVAYTCSKPRLEEFGGFAYKIWRDTYDAVNARSAAEKLEKPK